MQIALIAMLTAIGLIIVVMGFLGMRRGVYRGFVTLGGTLLGAVLIDVMQPNLTEWVQMNLRVESPGVIIWWIKALVFLAVALVIGYGGNVLVRSGSIPIKHDWRDMVVGGLLGALNGAVIVSYLLYYARALPSNSGVASIIALSPIVHVARDWLAWFMLTVVIGLTLVIMIRIAINVLKRYLLEEEEPESVPAADGQTAREPADQAVAAPGLTTPRSLTPADPADQAVVTRVLHPQASPTALDAGDQAVATRVLTTPESSPPGGPADQAIPTRVLDESALPIGSSALQHRPQVEGQPEEE